MLDFEVVCDDRSNYSNGPHAHVDDMLFLPVDGLFSIRSSERNNAGVLANGSIWWVPGRHVHQVTASRTQRHLCYYLDMRTLLSASGAARFQEAATARRWMMSVYLADLLRVRVHVHQRRSNSPTLSQAELDRAILAETGRIVSSVAAAGGRQPDAVVGDVKAYVRSHLQDDLRCGVVADLFGLAPRTLARWFQVVEGTSVGQFVLQSRLEQAKVLLQSTELAVSDIQDMVGFNSAAHFSYSVRRAFGQAPSQLRERVWELAKNR
jgi:AraC-like DNA-binding protein